MRNLAKNTHLTKKEIINLKSEICKLVSKNDLKNKYEDIVDEVAWDIVSDFYYEEDD